MCVLIVSCNHSVMSPHYWMPENLCRYWKDNLHCFTSHCIVLRQLFIQKKSKATDNLCNSKCKKLLCKIKPCKTGKPSSQVNWLNVTKICMSSDLWKPGISILWAWVINYVIQYSWFSWFCSLPICVPVCLDQGTEEFSKKSFECYAVSSCPVRLAAFGNQKVTRSWRCQPAKGKWRRMQY